MAGKNARVELGAEFLAASTNAVQAAESLYYALHGHGSYPLDKLFGPVLPRWTNRWLAGIVGMLYLISAAGETLKVVEDVTGEDGARSDTV